MPLYHTAIRACLKVACGGRLAAGKELNQPQGHGSAPVVSHPRGAAALMPEAACFFT